MFNHSLTGIQVASKAEIAPNRFYLISGGHQNTLKIRKKILKAVCVLTGKKYHLNHLFNDKPVTI